VSDPQGGRARVTGGEQRLSADDLRDVQALLSNGFRELPFAAYLFVHVESATAGRAWLASLLEDVTTAEGWRGSRGAAGRGERSADARRSERSWALNVAVSHAGLRALGLSEATLGTFPDEVREGMASPRRAQILGDVGANAPATWQLGGTGGPPLHVMLVLHGRDLAARAERRAREQARLAGFEGIAEIGTAAQEGHRPADQKEPFGFRDGIAQPRMKGLGGADVATGEFILGYPNHYGFVAPGPLAAVEDDAGHVLPEDPNPHHPTGAWRDLARHGSYLVYRKLEQDVAGFWSLMLREAERLRGRPDPTHAVFLASKLVGRWPSGAPLTLAPEHDEPRLGDANGFAYAEADAAGLRCPFGAHIRRMNPRDVVVPCEPAQSVSISASHRLLRRGRVYGTPLFDASVLEPPLDDERLEALRALRDDGRPRGIHFLAICADLHRQFEFVQQTWGNNPRFAGLVDNKDPMVGDSGREESQGFVTVPRAPLRERIGPLPALVTVRGGGYFFLPGLRALRFLASPLPKDRLPARVESYSPSR
jgi:Dyp-type peroxidase family